MDNTSVTSCIEPGAFAGKGAWTSFYAYEGGPARSQVLADVAGRLAGRAPVLMIDWDLESPGLHHLFGKTGERPGLLEYFEACRAQLATMAPDADATARRALAAVDWRAYVERVDPEHLLFLMRAGCMDATYGERAARLDWQHLFHACPALLRQFRARMAAAFRHVLVDVRGGRSAAVSVCTALLPDALVGVFTPAQRSLDGLCGVVARAIGYRCTHTDDQRPLLLYPWPAAGTVCAGYQDVLERLMAASYGYRHLSLENYFDQVTRDATPAALCTWLDDRRFPWAVDTRRMRQPVDRRAWRGPDPMGVSP